MKEDWKFADPENVIVITTRRILEDAAPVLLVTHDEDDGMWQFLDGSDLQTEDGRIVLLREMVERDGSINQLVDLPLGWRAWRSQAGEPWQRAKNQDEE